MHTILTVQSVAQYLFPVKSDIFSSMTKHAWTKHATMIHHVVIDWFDTILNHALVATNAVSVLSFMRAMKAQVVSTEQSNLTMPSFFALCL